MTKAGLKARLNADIVLRLLSAALLIPIALYVTWHGGWWLAVTTTVFAGLMAFEWARLTGERVSYVMIPFAIAANLCLIPYAPIVAGLILGTGALLVFIAMPGTFRERLAGGFGCLYAGGLPLAFLMIREGAWDGRNIALIIMAIVWVSDSAAYFAGKGFGGPLLSPKASPNKTWSGALGAIICSGLAGMIAARLMNADDMLWLAMGVTVSILTQTGDMFESIVKRRYGVKDVSGFLPGHGGVMDRLDGFGTVCVVLLLAFLLLPDMVAGLGFAA